ncbi:AaceriAFR503Wp [[Ashbya] aceris (nom. inval.)]|nr:AaceriAFR503Wp [[Ashbya] aceris (nom. inval.)]
MDVADIETLIKEEASISTDIDPHSIPEGDPQLQLRCNLYIHTLIRRWEEMEPAYLPDCLPELKRHLFPLLVRLRRGSLQKDLLTTLASLLYHLQQGEYSQAEQCYLDLSLGKVAWPIGVAGVGIHSAHDTALRIGTTRANVMKDEETRDWILQVKRLITFSIKSEPDSSGDEDDDD